MCGFMWNVQFESVVYPKFNSKEFKIVVLEGWKDATKNITQYSPGMTIT